jgi:hypothetical protein
MAGYGGSAFIFFGLLFLINELVLITAMPPAPPDHTQLFATMDKEFELLSLSEFLPRKLSAVCMRLANSFCLPIAGMITLVLALASIFSPTAYVTGLGNMVSPTLMVLGNIGFSSANKSGLYNLLMTTARKVTGALNALKSSYRTQEEEGVNVPSQNIPVEDKTANIPAGLSLLAQYRNAFRVDDEHYTWKRMCASSGEGAISVRLETFNEPPVMNDQGKSFNDTFFVPRANQVTFMQPELAMEEFGLTSNQVSGLSARISFNWLTKNFKLTKDIELFDEDWQTLTEFTAAVAARHVLECGTWSPKSEDAMSEILSDFLNGGDDSDLNDHDKGLLGLMQNDFTSSIPSAALAASHLSIWKDGQAKNKLMQRQAANSGTTPHLSRYRSLRP